MTTSHLASGIISVAKETERGERGDGGERKRREREEREREKGEVSKQEGQSAVAGRRSNGISSQEAARHVHNVATSSDAGAWMTFVLCQAFARGRLSKVKEESCQLSIEEQYLNLLVFYYTW